MFSAFQVSRGHAVNHFMFPPPKANLTTRERWLLYFVLTGLPGMNVMLWFGFSASMVYELVTWMPQQRLFDSLDLAKTLPFSKNP